MADQDVTQDMEKSPIVRSSASSQNPVQRPILRRNPPSAPAASELDSSEPTLYTKFPFDPDHVFRQDTVRDSIAQDPFFRIYSPSRSEQMVSHYSSQRANPLCLRVTPRSGENSPDKSPVREPTHGKSQPVRPRSKTSPERRPVTRTNSSDTKVKSSHNARKRSLPQIKPGALDKPLPPRPGSPSKNLVNELNQLKTENPPRLISVATAPAAIPSRDATIARTAPLPSTAQFDDFKPLMRVSESHDEIDKSSQRKPVSLSHLIQSLFQDPDSKSDATFIPVFLAVYRYFCRPSFLLDAIISHAKKNKESSSDSSTSSSDTLETILMILDQWITAYPGDFAELSTRNKVKAFLNENLGDSVFLNRVKLLQTAMENITHDDDTNWVNPDARNNSDGRPLSERSMQSTSSFTLSFRSNFANWGSLFETTNDEAQKLESRLAFDTESTISPISTNEEPISLDQNALSSSQTLLNASESAQRQAALLTPSPTTPLAKDHWHTFMDQPDSFIANELTRIDSIMFNALKTRDIIRHVTLPPNDRPLFPGLENIDRVITHFNHLASWTNNIVLLRDKPKHRALALEKLMRVARELRKCNNYNSLGALVAGIQSVAVHRLLNTRELVSQPTQRDFMKLEILMSARRSHAAYRMAWDNTTGPRIPFLPLHRRDLVVVESSSKTFIPPESQRDTPAETNPQDNAPNLLINWHKFSIMGSMLLDLQRARSTPYPEFAPNEPVKVLILDTAIIKDEDELYARSVALESSATASTAGSSSGPGGLESAKSKTREWLARRNL